MALSKQQDITEEKTAVAGLLQKIGGIHAAGSLAGKLVEEARLRIRDIELSAVLEHLRDTGNFSVRNHLISLIPARRDRPINLSDYFRVYRDHTEGLNRAFWAVQAREETLKIWSRMAAHYEIQPPPLNGTMKDSSLDYLVRGLQRIARESGQAEEGGLGSALAQIGKGWQDFTALRNGWLNTQLDALHSGFKEQLGRHGYLSSSADWQLGWARTILDYCVENGIPVTGKLKYASLERLSARIARKQARIAARERAYNRDNARTFIQRAKRDVRDSNIHSRGAMIAKGHRDLAAARKLWAANRDVWSIINPRRLGALRAGIYLRRKSLQLSMRQAATACGCRVIEAARSRTSFGTSFKSDLWLV